MQTADTAENFLDVEKKHVLGMPERFEGKTLAPYSEGVRLLWMNVFLGVIARFTACGLIYILTRLQEEYEKQKDQKDEDSRWLYASAALLEETEDRAVFKARVLKWASLLGEKKTEEAHKLANRIITDANRTDAKDEPEANQEGSELGNVVASPLTSPSTSSVELPGGDAT